MSRMLQQIARKVDTLTNKKYYNYPFGKSPKATKDQYLAIWKKAQADQFKVIDAYEAETGFSINQEWLHQLALHTQIVIKESKICYPHGRLLYACLSKYLKDTGHSSINIIETGTARGFSSLCMSKALSDHNTAGKIITFDILPHDQKMFWNCIDDLEGAKSRHELLKDYHSLIDKYLIFNQGDSKIQLPKFFISRVHFAYLDAAHTYVDVMFEFKNIKEKQQAGDIIVFDDYTSTLFPGVIKAVDEICADYGYHKRIFKIDNNRGYVIAEKK